MPPPLIPPPGNILTGLSVAIAAAASWIPPPPPFPSLAPPAHASSFKSASNTLLLHPLRHHMMISLRCFSFFCCSPSSSSSFSSPRPYLPTNTAPRPKTPPFRHQTKQTTPKKKKLPTLMHQTTSKATTQSPYNLHNPQKNPKTGRKHDRTPQQKAAAATTLWRWRGSQKGVRRARCLLAGWLQSGFSR